MVGYFISPCSYKLVQGEPISRDSLCQYSREDHGSCGRLSNFVIAGAILTFAELCYVAFFISSLDIKSMPAKCIRWLNRRHNSPVYVVPRSRELDGRILYLGALGDPKGKVVGCLFIKETEDLFAFIGGVKTRIQTAQSIAPELSYTADTG